MTATKYVLVPVVATEEMVAAARSLASCPVRDAVNAAIAAAPPFVVTDEVARKAVSIFMARRNDQPDATAMRAAIEAVLGGGV